MKRSDELRQWKADKMKEMRDLASAAEGRAMTKEERGKFNDLKSEVEDINQELEAILMLEAEESRSAQQQAQQRQSRGVQAGGEDREKEKIQRSYSILRAISLRTNGKPLDGLELEMQQEAQKEMRESNVSVEGNIQIPSMLSKTYRTRKVSEARDMTVGSAADGGYTVATDLGDLIPLLEPRLMAREMGATILSGLVGDLDLPRNTSDSSASWEGEINEVSESNPGFDKISLSPKRLAALTLISKKVMVQSSLSVENFVRRRMNFAVRRSVDLACYNGSGTGNEPTGILNTPGIGDVVGGTNGAIPNWNNIVGLETEVAVDDADIGRLGYVLTPGMRGVLKTQKLDAGSGRFIWPVNGKELNGYRTGVTTQVPSNLVKGSSSDCHAIIFGNWEDLIIAQWAGIDLTVDPFKYAEKGQVRLVVNSFWDLAVRHAQSFAAMKDAKTS
ncbi:MAG: phage major capsid protein [Bacteroidota bacterium]